jgi:hypothetical protein
MYANLFCPLSTCHRGKINMRFMPWSIPNV